MVVSIIGEEFQKIKKKVTDEWNSKKGSVSESCHL